MEHSFHSLPQYQQIAATLRQKIQDETYRPGDKLPTEKELSEQFGVNRHTLRRAIAVLKQSGLVRVDHGRGTFVAAAPIVFSIDRRIRFNETLRAQGYHVTYQTLRTLEIKADESPAKNLKLSEGSAIFLIERLSIIDAAPDGLPICISSHYFPAERFPGLLEHYPNHNSVSKVLQSEYQCDHVRLKTRISARTVSLQDARHLAVSQQAPILLTEAINTDQNGDRIEYGVSRFRGDIMEVIFAHDES